jgi:hypothetical protein
MKRVRVFFFSFLAAALKASQAKIPLTSFNLFTRTYKMNKSIATFIVAAAASFSLAVFASGCNGGSSQNVSQMGTNPQPAPTLTPIPGPPVRILPVPTPTFTACGCQGNVCAECVLGPPITENTNNTADSTNENVTRDTDLQQSQLQQATIATRVTNLTNQFGMSYSAATQLAQLADQVQQMTANSQELTTDDRNAITATALNIANITTDEVSDAFTKSMQGDQTATEALLQRAAIQLGMKSSADVRTQLLPALGVQL